MGREGWKVESWQMKHFKQLVVYALRRIRLGNCLQALAVIYIMTYHGSCSAESFTIFDSAISDFQIKTKEAFVVLTEHKGEYWILKF